MPEITPLSSSAPQVAAGHGNMRAALLGRILRVTTPSIAPANLGRGTAVLPPHLVKPPSTFATIRRALTPRCAPTLQRGISRLADRMLGPAVSWTPSPSSTLSELPMPPAGAQRVLAARQNEAGETVLRWSRKEKVPQGEHDLAKTEVGRLVAGEIQRQQGNPDFMNGAKTLPSWIDRQINFTPTRVANALKVLEEPHTKAEEAYSDAVGKIVEKLRGCAVSRQDGPVVARRETRFTEDLPDRRTYRDLPGETHEAPRQALEPFRTKVLMDDFVANMPESVLSATRQVCGCIASQMDELSIAELVHVQGSVKAEIGQAGSWAALKESLRAPPTDGRDCLTRHVLAAKLLAGRDPQATLSSSVTGTIELLHKAAGRFGPEERANADLESALVGGMFALECLAAETEPGRRAAIDFEALSKAVQHPQTREALEKSLSRAKEAVSEASTSRPFPAPSTSTSSISESSVHEPWEVDDGLVAILPRYAMPMDEFPGDPRNDRWWETHQVTDDPEVQSFPNQV